MSTDDWLRSAVSDDTLVAELLLRLKQHPPSRLHSKATSLSLPPLEWGTKQPRSKAVESKKEADPTAATRRSPTTPLSWSGGRSGGGVSPPSDGYEESSVPSDPYPDVRSKGIVSSNMASKRSRRKKTLAELKEEESSLLKERSYLKRELASLLATLEERKTVNQSLKRMKIGLQAASGAKSCPTLNESVAQSSSTSLCMEETSAVENTPSQAPKHIIQEVHPSLPESGPTDKHGPGGQELGAFVLPDLNTVPEDFGTEGFLGTS